MNYKIAGYITAYQEKQALQNCLEGIKKQSYPVQEIFIVDNSQEQLIPSTEQIIVDFHPENIGISGGLKIAVNWAKEKGYDFLWTFDQDSDPLPDTLEKLIIYYDKLTLQGLKIGVIGPLPIDRSTGQKLYGINFQKYKFVPFDDENIDFYSCDAIITSGCLVSMEAAKNVELPREGLFIDSVDWDYCLNFKKQGYEVILVNKAILNHRFGGSYKVPSIIKRPTITIYNYSPLRYYYMCRNHTFIETRLAKQNKQLFLSIIYRILGFSRYVAKIVLYEDNKIPKTWACVQGTYHGFIGKLGKTW